MNMGFYIKRQDIKDTIKNLKLCLTTLSKEVSRLRISNQKGEHNDLIIDIEQSREAVNNYTRDLNRELSELLGESVQPEENNKVYDEEGTLLGEIKEAET